MGFIVWGEGQEVNAAQGEAKCCIDLEAHPEYNKFPYCGLVVQ